MSAEALAQSETHDRPQRDPARDPRTLGELAHYLAEVLNEPAWLEGPAVRRLSGGMSYDTWLLEAGAPELRTFAILRREPASGPLEPYDIAHEVSVVRSLEGSRVPVPSVLHFCQDRTLLDGPFAVMEYIPGEIPDYRTFPDWPGWGETRRTMARRLMEVLVELQRVDWRQTPLSRQIGTLSAAPPIVSRIDQLSEVVAVRARAGGWTLPPVFAYAISWLRQTAPPLADEETVLVHGDFKVGNFIWRDDRIAGLLDWEAAWVGDPHQDLGYLCQPLARERFPELMGNMVELDELIAFYEAAGGRPVDRARLHYYAIYGLLFSQLATVLSALMALAENGGEMRLALAYQKLGQASVHLLDQIHAFEEGRGVL